MPAPKGNQNNKKPADESKSAWFKMRALPLDKSNWIGKARSEGKNLTEWVTGTLNASINEEK